MIFLKVKLGWNDIMLNPSKDRLDYGNILHHDDNYKLDFAIGATYSLELDSLILSAISLDSYGEFDKNLINKPILLLNALRKTSNKIALFCESGQILFNDNRRKVYVLLEDIVFPVLTSKEFENNHYASYHPKFWLIRYTKEDNIRYRIIVLSRNLTSNRSWDISFVMDGNISDNQTNKNDALIEFIKYSIDNSVNNKKSINHEKIEKMNEIIDELKHVDFNLDSDIFSDFEFIVNGVDDRSYQIQNQPLFQKNWDRILIMTPFLSKDVISKFNKKINVNSNSILISQSDSFKKLTKEDCDNFNLYCLRDEIVNGEREISEEDTDFYNQDIHAKIYVCEKNNCCELYLGSLNASCNALRGNIELMVKLKSKNLTVEQISQNIFNNGGDNPFEEYLIKNNEQDDDKTEDDNSNYIIKQIIRLNPKAKVTSSDDLYNIEVEFGENPFKDKDIELCPLLSNNSQKFSEKMIFENLNKLLLSEFFIIRINEIERIIKIETEGMPNDRKNEVISNIIRNKDDFIEYISLLFGDDYYSNFISPDEKSKDFSKQFYVQLSGLYEKMLQASIYDPDKFDDIKDIIESLSDEKIVPDGFNELYNTFLEVIDK